MKKKRKSVKRKAPRTRSWVAAIVAAVLSVVIFWGFCWLRDNRLPNFKKSAHIYVYPETTAEEALSTICREAGAISRRSLERAFADKETAGNIKPGHYVVNPSNTSVYVARMLNNGWQTPVRMTLSGSLRSKGELARKISANILLDSAAVRASLDDKDLLARYGMTPETAFALFFPDTYEVYWNASMEDILDGQKKVFDAFWTDANIAKGKKLHLSKVQIATLASIVKSETNYEPERARIAGVYLNRLDKGMLLQADPTVAWCFDYKPTRILRSHLAVDSPYNTYKHAGLPPGPICVPGKASLEAVLNPDRGNGNLFFCANADFSGTHVFAKTLSEHNANARAFQAELTRRMRAKKQ